MALCSRRASDLYVNPSQIPHATKTDMSLTVVENIVTIATIDNKVATAIDAMSNALLTGLEGVHCSSMNVIMMKMSEMKDYVDAKETNIKAYTTIMEAKTTIMEAKTTVLEANGVEIEKRLASLERVLKKASKMPARKQDKVVAPKQPRLSCKKMGR